MYMWKYTKSQNYVWYCDRYYRKEQYPTTVAYMLKCGVYATISYVRKHSVSFITYLVAGTGQTLLALYSMQTFFLHGNTITTSITSKIWSRTFKLSVKMNIHREKILNKKREDDYLAIDSRNASFSLSTWIELPAHDLQADNSIHVRKDI